MNHFASAAMAKRYAQGRPFYHSLILNHILNHLSIEKKMGRALDIACGTGLSTRILPDLAEEVFATDLSEEMLAFAKKRVEASFSLSPAEKQPFPAHHFDLITVSSGVHWFDIDLFLKEIKRLLTKDGYLILYDNFFLGQMKEEESFKAWTKERYFSSFPTPARNRNYDWSKENLAARGLKLEVEDNMKNEYPFSHPELCTYLSTLSNINAAATSGNYSFEEIDDWLKKELLQFYLTDDEKKHILYRANIKYIKKIF
ncbi:MAG: class I SAM-dependent methyltransferase [Bacteroidia bacterium]|nr:class I SAM-dependent methyltransferase [Bacteroidia bacterium]